MENQKTSQQKKSLQNLNKFLSIHRVVGNTPYTHTKMCGGKYNIPDDKLEEF